MLLESNNSPIADGDIIDLANFDTTELTISVLPKPEAVGSVVFSLNGIQYTDNIPPYTLLLDNTGTYTITATAYTELDGEGQNGETQTLMFELINTNVSPSSPRVTANLQALYTFDEGGGLLINDVSGVGAPMDLTIDNQYAVTWAADGLTLNSATVIDSRGPATKFINAARATNALTIEAWVTPANITQDGPAHMITY
jgi:hypothetical protein